MTMTASLVQAQTAQMGMGTPYVLTVSNSSGSPVNVNSILVVITTPSGNTNVSAVTSGPFPTVGQGIAQVGGSQWNVQVPANGSYNFSFGVIFFGPATSTYLAAPAQQYLVSANVQTSDGAVFTPPPVMTAVNQPQLGVINAPNYTAPNPGQLVFQYPSQSSLTL
jgi:hypothetical protein